MQKNFHKFMEVMSRQIFKAIGIVTLGYILLFFDVIAMQIFKNFC